MARVRAGKRLTVAAAAASLLFGMLATSDVGAVVATGGSTVDCTGSDDTALQTALDGSANDDTITIDGLCTGAFTMKTGVLLTLQGDPDTGEATDGFDGTGEATGSLLTGTDIGASTIQHLVFRNGSIDGNGGGLSIAGSSAPQLINLEFTENNASTTDGAGNGGGLFINANVSGGETLLSNVTFSGNTAQNNGGGFYIDSSPHIRLDNVTAMDNHAAITAPIGEHGGGGGFVRAFPFFEGDGFGVESLAEEAPGIEVVNSTFTGNTSDSNGGGLLVGSASESFTVTLAGNTFGGAGEGDGNTAEQGGGGLYIFSQGDVAMSDNDFMGNDTPRNGGGAWIGVVNNGQAVLEGNLFSGNVLSSDEGVSDHWGGGLYVQHFGSLPEGDALTQVGNVFLGNEVMDVTEGEAGGGGEWIVGARTLSRYDVFVDNVVTNDTSDDTEGGGIGLVGSANGTTLRLQNAVVAGNSLDNDGGPGSGGGVYVGISCTPCNEILTMEDTTVAGNTVTAPIIGPGVGGGGEADSLTAANSIVAGNTTTGGEATADIAGFTTTAVSFSDSCAGPGFTGGAVAGDGNICADPLLVDPSPGAGDVRQTASSPTVDRGNNALVPAELTTDSDGEARIADGNEDGTATVDMGADELVPVEEETTEEGEPHPGDGVTPPGSIGENDGYCLGAADGGVFAFGNCQFAGAARAGSGMKAAAVTAPSGAQLAAPMVGLAMTPDNKGYWMAGADGGVFAFGSAPFKGSLGGITLQKPIVGIASTPTGQGYWLVDSGGAVYGFGDAKVPGSTSGIKLNKPIVAMAATPSGQGYWLVAEDGGVFAFGDATFRGSTGSIRLNQPMIGLAAFPGGTGYWLVAEDGGVFAFGSAPFKGSFGATLLNKPIVAIKGTSTGNGYWLVASDGGVFSFGSAPFRGSAATLKLNQPIVDMTG